VTDVARHLAPVPEAPEGTLLCLTDRLLPESAAEQHRYGWDHFLHVLADRLARRT
jgi:hypothetical protein